MISLQPYTSFPPQSKIKQAKDIVDNNIFDETYTRIKIKWEDLSEEKNKLSFMELFNFPPLDELRKSLEATNIYSKEEIDEEIKALSELPEYRN